MTTNKQSFEEFKIQPGDKLLTTKEYKERYKISYATQCRQRKDGTGPPFISHNGKILYLESAVITHFNSMIVKSSAELDQEKRVKRYAHLPAAREKARSKLRELSNPHHQQSESLLNSAIAE